MSTLLMIINTRIISICSSNEISLIKTHISTIDGLLFDPHNDLFPVGPIAQLGEHSPASQRSGSQSRSGQNFLGHSFAK